jgi:hypothetical protein
MDMYSCTVLIAALGALVFITGVSVFNSVILLILGFLISPLGLRAVIEWFIDRLADLNDSLKNYVMG